MVYVIFLVYCVWAIYSGYKFVDGRWAFLEKKKPLNVILKILMIIIMGSWYGFINLLYYIIKAFVTLVKIIS